jgi:hypothetical protein
MGELATVTYSPLFRTLGPATRAFCDVVLAESATIVKREEQAHIRRLWYRTGATLNSLAERTVDEGQKRIYQLFPTTFYAPFGEYGTGRAGASSGRPAPRGYVYGQSKGIVARRYSRLAVTAAKPQVDARAAELARRFAANMTN